MDKKFIILPSRINDFEKKSSTKEKEKKCPICNKENGCKTVKEAYDCPNNPRNKIKNKTNSK